MITHRHSARAAALALACIAASHADAAQLWPAPVPNSTISETDPFAWSQNLGWINARHNQPAEPAGIVVTPYRLYGTAWAQNAGWIMFGDGTPCDGLRYSNTRADDCGVNIDCDLNLSGFAWAQNLGWINFGWASPTNADRPRVDNSPTSRWFHGYAWSQNAGWINLATLSNSFINAGGLDIEHDGLPDQWEFFMAGGTDPNWFLLTGLDLLDATSDTDGDGLPDSWEFTNFRALTITNGSGDFDQDGSTDAAEFALASNPRDALSFSPPLGSSITANGNFAWAQNAGWINLRHNFPSTPSGVITGDYFLSGDAWGQNIGWIKCGSGTPADGIRYSNTAAADCGVNHDGTGNLSGYAWSQNAGWINFGWAAPGHADRPRINLVTGNFTGYAWGQNLGWIRLAGLITGSLPITDTDADGLTDAWEREHFGNLTAASAATDSDSDGDTDAAEFLAGTNPASAASRFEILSFTLSPSGL